MPSRAAARWPRGLHRLDLASPAWRRRAAPARGVDGGDEPSDAPELPGTRRPRGLHGGRGGRHLRRVAPDPPVPVRDVSGAPRGRDRALRRDVVPGISPDLRILRGTRGGRQARRSALQRNFLSKSCKPFSTSPGLTSRSPVGGATRIEGDAAVPVTLPLSSLRPVVTATSRFIAPEASAYVPAA